MANLAPAVGMAAALLAAMPAWAQSGRTTSGIYTCVDAHGRRLTSDRPILACIDREQRELSSSGTTRRVIQPSMTAVEREARAAQEREAEAERQRQQNIARLDQALITRYPDKAAHDAARVETLSQTQSVIHAAELRIAELAAERKALDDEMEFYKKDPTKAPGKVRRGIEDNKQAMEVQRRAIAAQQEERARINARFDEEVARLQPLWQARAAALASSTASGGAATTGNAKRP
ncbi:MAG: DUF4124 domain-containing protein [Pseudomonadota bacterium]|nr:DUF4124 domain-containing protein [Pseudomonadota bacterium]